VRRPAIVENQMSIVAVQQLFVVAIVVEIVIVVVVVVVVVDVVVVVIVVALIEGFRFGCLVLLNRLGQQT
jgi:hypothetical protein